MSRRFQIVRRALSRTALLGFTLLFGCSGMPSYEAMFDPSPEAEGTGIVGTGVVRAIVIIAKYQASERQRRVAEERARVAYARMAQERKVAVETPSQGGAPSGQRAQTKPKKKLPRYIAVDTEPDARSRGKKAIMLWDTQAQEIVGNQVYDVERPPRPLETARFETYAAEYVGVGL